MHKKVAFIGSVGSGKTTIVENLSNIDALNTDVKSTEDIGKEMTTVGIDYGHIELNEEISLGLYGVPGQRKFSMIWDFVKTGLWAVVILVKNNEFSSIDEIDYLVEYFEIDQGLPCVIGVTHADEVSADETIHHIHEKLHALELNIPVYTIDPRVSSNATLIMHTLIAIDEAQ